MLKLVSSQYIKGRKDGEEAGKTQKMYGGVNEVEHGILPPLPPNNEYRVGYREGYTEGYSLTHRRFDK